MSAFSLSQMLFGASTEEKVREADELILNYFDAVPNINAMFQQAKEFASIKGYVETYFKRRRYFTDINSDNYITREGERRKAANTKVQGTAADIMKIAHCRVEDAFETVKDPITGEKGIDCRVVASIHDELVILVNKKYNPYWMLSLLRKEMELELKGFPPLFIGASVARTWADGKKDEFEIPVGLSTQRVNEVKLGLHKEPMKDPHEQVSADIDNFIIARIRKELIENGITNFEGAMENTKVISYLTKYFGYNAKKSDTIETAKSIITSIFDNSEYRRDMIKFINGVSDKEETLEWLEEMSELDREDIIDDEHDEFGEETVVYNESAILRLYNENKENLKLKEPVIKKASKVFVSDYRVMVANRVCYIRLENPTKGLILDLRNYLKDNSKPKGHDVKLNVNGKIVDVPYKLSTVNRIDILDILDKHDKTKKEKVKQP